MDEQVGVTNTEANPIGRSKKGSLSAATGHFSKYKIHYMHDFPQLITPTEVDVEPWVMLPAEITDDFCDRWSRYCQKNLNKYTTAKNYFSIIMAQLRTNCTNAGMFARVTQLQALGTKLQGKISTFFSDRAHASNTAKTDHATPLTMLATGGMNIGDLFYRWYDEKLYNADIPASTSDKAEFTKHAKLVAMLKRFLLTARC